MDEDDYGKFRLEMVKGARMCTPSTSSVSRAKFSDLGVTSPDFLIKNQHPCCLKSIICMQLMKTSLLTIKCRPNNDKQAKLT